MIIAIIALLKVCNSKINEAIRLCHRNSFFLTFINKYSRHIKFFLTNSKTFVVYLHLIPEHKFQFR
jgi:hypothetical protein